MVKYLQQLTIGKVILWCYLIWYLVTIYFYFDPAPILWINSLGISAIIGIALLLSVNNEGAWKINQWQTFRLFVIPFCVSSFSSIIKDKGYLLMIPPSTKILFISLGFCAAFVCTVFLIKRYVND